MHGKLSGFAIASSMFRWVWADAKIEGDTVIVSAPTVPSPQEEDQLKPQVRPPAGLAQERTRTRSHNAAHQPEAARC